MFGSIDAEWYTLDIWSCDAVSRLSPKLLLACTYNVLTRSISSYSLLFPKLPSNPRATVTVIQPATTMVTISRASRAMSTAEEEKLTVWTWESEPECATANDSILQAVGNAVSPSTSLVKAGLASRLGKLRTPSGEGATRVAACEREHHPTTATPELPPSPSATTHTTLHTPPTEQNHPKWVTQDRCGRTCRRPSRGRRGRDRSTHTLEANACDEMELHTDAVG